MLEPLEYPLIDDMDSINVGSIFRIEDLRIGDQGTTLNVVALFTGYQRQNTEKEVFSIQIIVLEVYSQSSGRYVHSEITQQTLWIDNPSVARNSYIHALVEMIREAKNPQPPKHLS